MPNKHLVTSDANKVKRAKALVDKANRIPGPPSVILEGSSRPVNVCPRCLAKEPSVKTPCSDYPWTCPLPSCGWTAASDPTGCSDGVRDIEADGAGNYTYALDEVADNPLLTSAEQAEYAALVSEAVDEKPKGPPDWAPAKGLR